MPKEFKEFEGSIAFVAHEQLRAPEFERGWVIIRPGFKGKKRIDLTNSFKGVLDGLVKGRVFSDDIHVAGTVTPAEEGRDGFTLEIWA